MIINRAIDNENIITLASQKLIIDRKITEILKQENPNFSYKKLVADLGEYHAKRNIDFFFEELQFSPNRVSECDLVGTLKLEYSEKWNLQREVKIEVKTRYWQKGSAHLGNVHKDNFHILVFVSLNEDYSIHYISMVKSSDLVVTSKNKVIYNGKVEPLFATEEMYIKHK